MFGKSVYFTKRTRGNLQFCQYSLNDISNGCIRRFKGHTTMLMFFRAYGRGRGIWRGGGVGWSCTGREAFGMFFRGGLAHCFRGIISGVGTGRWPVSPPNSGVWESFPSFLRSLILSRSTTREKTTQSLPY